jgi:hypothetical protein
LILLWAEHSGGGASTARRCRQSTAAAGPRLVGGGARSAMDLAAEQRVSDGFGRLGGSGGARSVVAELESERVREGNRSHDFLLRQRKCLLPLDVNERHPRPPRQRSRILHYGRGYESLDDTQTHLLPGCNRPRTFPGPRRHSI